MAALTGAGLMPALRGLGTAAFRVVGTWTAEPGRLYDPGCRHYSFEQATGGVLAHGEDFYAGSVSAMLQPALVSVIRDCPQRFSVSSVPRALGSGSPETPLPLLTAWNRDSGAVRE